MKVAVYQKVVVTDFFVHIMFKRLKIAKNMHEIKKCLSPHVANSDEVGQRCFKGIPESESLVM